MLYAKLQITNLNVALEYYYVDKKLFVHLERFMCIRLKSPVD